jgi:hypothetical protein
MPRGRSDLDQGELAPAAQRLCSVFLAGPIMSTLRRDPAERGYLRFFYRNWRPALLAKVWNGAFAWLAGLGLLPQILLTLQVKSRRSDRLYSTVLAAVNYGGQRYLVSMPGNASNWVQDVRAAQGKAFIKRGRSRAVILTEIPPGERASILKAWCEAATSGRKHLPVRHDAPVSAFESIAADYPVFRIDTVVQT